MIETLNWIATLRVGPRETKNVNLVLFVLKHQKSLHIASFRLDGIEKIIYGIGTKNFSR